MAMLDTSFARRAFAVMLAVVAPLAARAGSRGVFQFSGPSEEDKAFTVAHQEFVDMQFSLAETNFNAFLNSWSNSVHRADAMLFLARSRLAQSNYSGAITPLEQGLAGAGTLAPDYLFWAAKARYGEGDFPAAAMTFGRMTAQYPASPLVLEAAYDQADAWSKARDWPRVIEQLSDTNSAFQGAARASPHGEFALGGALLLAEAYRHEKEFDAGERVLDAIEPAGLDAETAWRRQYILGRIELDAGRASSSLTNADALLAAAGPRHRASALFLRGEALEQLGRVDAALACYTNNLAAGTPADAQREALSKTIGLTVRQGWLDQGVDILDAVAQRPGDPNLDLARLGVGELCLRLYSSPPPGAAPADAAAYLRRAGTNFDGVLRDFTNSPLLGKARLDDGWLRWAEGDIAGAGANFAAAASTLPRSEDQAVALFKLGDAQFRQKDFAGAVSNYSRLLRDYAATPSVTNKLFDLALYQVLQASLAQGDDQGAAQAAARILAWYPESYYGGRGLLLLGEDLRRKNDYAAARAAFAQLLSKIPNTPLRPQAEFAIARTYDQEGNWTAALDGYSRWLADHASDPLAPQVEFSRALAYDRAGMQARALQILTNFVARYPSNSMAPWAQNWVATYYFNLPDFPAAEKNFEMLYQNLPNPGPLAWQARLMAGRSALAGQRPVDAAAYFSDLVSDTNTPAPILAKAYFALGDAFFEQFEASPASIGNLNNAIAALSNLTNGAPTNAIAAQAFGRLGDFYMHFADLRSDAKVYTNAMAMYQAVLDFPPGTVDAQTRAQAEVGLGRIAEELGQSETALAHYCKVLYEMDPAQVDAVWINQAGVGAARVCESLRQWDRAIHVYKRVETLVPSLQGALDKKIAVAQAQSEGEKN